MPTGYTAKLCEGEQSFVEFALHCARAFGACIEQRDDPMSDLPKIPKKSSYHEDQLNIAVKVYDGLVSMTDEQREEFGQLKKTELIAHEVAMIDKIRLTKARLLEMTQHVLNWAPPSSEHLEFKKFMLQQLNDTISYDGDDTYSVRELSKYESMTPMDFYQQALDSAQWIVDYHKKGMVEDANKSDDRAEWIISLYDSLGLKQCTTND